MNCGVLVVLSCILVCIHSESYRDRHHLHDDLMYRYDKHVVPNGAEGPGVNVTLAVNLIRIIGLEDYVLTLDTYMPQYWQAENLKWRPGHVGGMNKIILPNDHFWKPDLALVDGAEESVFLHNEHANIIIYSNGNVTWWPPVKSHTYCHHEELHDGDEIECHVNFYSWSHSTATLDIKLESDEMNLSRFDADFSSHWKLVSTHGAVEHKVYSCCPDAYAKASYTLRLRYVA